MGQRTVLVFVVFGAWISPILLDDKGAILLIVMDRHGPPVVQVVVPGSRNVRIVAGRDTIIVLA